MVDAAIQNVVIFCFISDNVPDVLASLSTNHISNIAKKRRWLFTTYIVHAWTEQDLTRRTWSIRLATSRTLGERNEPCLAAKRLNASDQTKDLFESLMEVTARHSKSITPRVRSMSLFRSLQSHLGCIPHRLSKRQSLSKTTVLFSTIRSPGRSKSTYFWSYLVLSW